MNNRNSNSEHVFGGFAVGTTLAIVLLALLVNPSAASAQHYLTEGTPNGVVLLAPPPDADSAEQKADLELVRSVFKNRTPAEEAQAVKEASPSCFLFSRAIGPNFRPGKFPKTEALLKKVGPEISRCVKGPKVFWHRKRPYQIDTQLSFGASSKRKPGGDNEIPSDPPASSFSYPSGHSARGTVYALILAEIFQAKREPILAVGRDIGWDRVVIGKHFLSDVQAGRVLAQAIFRELMNSPPFQHDLAAAKAEAQATTPAD